MQVTLSSIKIAEIHNEIIRQYSTPSETIVVTSDDYFANYKIEKILISDIKKIAEACKKSGYVTSDWMETSIHSNAGWSAGFSFGYHARQDLEKNAEAQLFSKDFASGIQAGAANAYYLNRRTVAPIITKILDAPVEHTDEQITYRILSSMEALSTKGMDSNAILQCSTDYAKYPGVLVVPHTLPLYNYLDKGNYLLFYRRNSQLVPLVVNDLSFDLYKLLLLISLLGKHLGVSPLEGIDYLNIGIKRDFLRTSVLRLENTLSKIREKGNHSWEDSSMFGDYFGFSKAITNFLMLNAKNQLYSQLMNGEIESFKLDDMIVTKDKISYETVSVEYPKLTTVLKDRITHHNTQNNNPPLTIYDIVDEVVSMTVKKLRENTTPRYDDKNKNVLGFTADFSLTIKINDLPITLSITTKDTRRRINGFRINESELADVLKHATCYRELEQYNLFLRDVQNMSLLARKALTNGVPMKFELINDNDYFELKRPATARHPKLKFVMRDGTVYLICKASDTDMQYFKVNRFTSCVQWLNVIDRKTRARLSSEYWRADRTVRLKEEFRRGIGQFCPQLAGMTLLQDCIIDAACTDRVVAKQRSEKLLKEIVEQLGCTEGEYAGEAGYCVKGKLRNYFVSKVAPYKVWNHDTGHYICIVNGQHYEGVGYDALVARLLALANDTYATEFISTLKAA